MKKRPHAVAVTAIIFVLFCKEPERIYARSIR